MRARRDVAGDGHDVDVETPTKSNHPNLNSNHPREYTHTDGKCVVIGLQSTGEAVAKRMVQQMKAYEERAAARQRRSSSAGVNYRELNGDEEDEDEEGMDVDGGKGKGNGKAPAPVGAKRKQRTADERDEDFVAEEEGDGEEDEEEGGGAGDGGEDEDEEWVGIESTLIEIIKKFVPDQGQGMLAARDAAGTRLPHKEPFFYAQKKADLIAAVQRLELPRFPLDDLMHQLGTLRLRRASA